MQPEPQSDSANYGERKHAPPDSLGKLRSVCKLRRRSIADTRDAFCQTGGRVEMGCQAQEVCSFLSREGRSERVYDPLLERGNSASMTAFG